MTDTAKRIEDTETITWLEDEFPEWSVETADAANWSGDDCTIWIARREGHHPQSELSPAKLHTRLSEYLHREHARQALMN